MKLLDIISEDESKKCEKAIAMAKKIVPFLVDGEITYREHDSIMKYVLKKELTYRCNHHINDEGIERIDVFPTLEVHQNHPFPFDVYIDGVKRYPNLWDAETKIYTFDHFCELINKKCKKFGLHFASKMH
jgi:hypothetical protein